MTQLIPLCLLFIVPQTPGGALVELAVPPRAATKAFVPCSQDELDEGEDSADTALEPQEIDYGPLAFYPKRWKREKVETEMLAWEGEQVVFITRKGDYDAEVLSQFVRRLDQGWKVYGEIVGASPRPFKRFNEKPTICAIPKADLSCGYGCGYVGATGIEASAFYRIDLPKFEQNPKSFQHYYFYEMGRNYFVFGDRHSLFTTGFAVLMRYVCMDELECEDTDGRTRRTIESCEAIYADSDLGFYDTFTNLGQGEKSNRLRDSNGRVIVPSDQPVMYATAMMKLRNDYGGNDWMQRFCHRLRETKPKKARDLKSAETQGMNWLVCSSAAAKQDLCPVFVDRWRMPLNAQQRQVMEQTDWESPKLNVSEVVEQLLSAQD